MQVKEFLTEHFYTQILTISEYREQIIKRLLEKPKNASLLSLYEMFTASLTELENKLAGLEVQEPIPTPIEDEYEEEEEEEERPFFKDETETTKLVAEEELVELHDYTEKGIRLDAEPNFWTLVYVKTGKGVWKLQAEKSSKVEVPLYMVTKAEAESVKKSFRNKKGARVWVQTESWTSPHYPNTNEFKFGACMTILDKNYKWGIQPNASASDSDNYFGLEEKDFNFDFNFKSFTDTLFKDSVTSNVDSIEV